MDWLIWVVVAIVVLAVLAAVVVAGTKQKRKRDRSTAAEIREEAAQRAPDLQRDEARARETEAAAAAAEAEAERKAAEADRLAAEAQHRRQSADQTRQEQAETLHRADQIDPDVDSRRGDGVADREAGAAPATTTGAATGTGTGTGSAAPAGSEGTTSLAQDHPPTETERVASSSEESTVTHPDGSTEPVRDRRDDVR